MIKLSREKADRTEVLRVVFFSDEWGFRVSTKARKLLKDEDFCGFCKIEGPITVIHNEEIIWVTCSEAKENGLSEVSIPRDLHHSDLSLLDEENRNTKRFILSHVAYLREMGHKAYSKYNYYSNRCKRSDAQFISEICYKSAQSYYRRARELEKDAMELA